MPTGFLFSELTAAAPDRAFDGLVVGTFRDMHGNVHTFKTGELETYVANTLAAINATRGESGELVGLPIDAHGHEKGDGAGWIVGVELVGNVIRLLPKWTEIGLELIGKNIRRFFSGTIDTTNKVILGGTLTNWPATRDSQGKILLRPIELSSGLYELADDSLEDKAMQVRQAFHAAHQPEMDTPWVVDVYDEHVICRHGDKLYRVPYTTKDGEIAFAAQSEWAEVKPAYVEAMQAMTSALRSFFGRFLPGMSQPAPTPAPPEGVLEMEITPEKLKEMIDAAVKAAVPAPAQPPAGQTPATVDLASLFSLDGLSEEAKAQRKAQLEAHLAQVRQQAELEYQGQLVQMQRESAIVELSQRLIGGSADAPRGLPGVTAEDLRAHLLKLPAAEGKWFGDLLARAVKDGLVEFGELGHGKRLEGTVELAAEYAAQLRSWVENKDAAGKPGDIAEWFRVNPEVGEMRHYNLQAFKPA